MIKASAFLVAIASSLYGMTASAAAKCEGPTLDGNTWNLTCAADAGDSGDDYQCDYILSLTYAEGDPEQEEASGSVSPGQSGVIIWSAVVNGDESDIVSADIDSGSCSQ
jgi:hypothetical protein